MHSWRSKSWRPLDETMPRVSPAFVALTAIYLVGTVFFSPLNIVFFLLACVALRVHAMRNPPVPPRPRLVVVQRTSSQRAVAEPMQPFTERLVGPAFVEPVPALIPAAAMQPLSVTSSTLASCGALMVAALRTKGFFQVHISAEEFALVDKAVQASAVFFRACLQQPEAALKLRRVRGDGKWTGYAHPLAPSARMRLKLPWNTTVPVARMNRRWFQVRRGGETPYPMAIAPDGATWPAEVVQGFAAAMEALFALLQAKADEMLLVIADHCDGLSRDAVRAMLDERSDAELKAQDTFGANVLRAYEYRKFRRVFDFPATGVHADMGLLTVSPRSNLPGLVVIDPLSGGRVDVEAAQPAAVLNVFAGEVLERLSQGRLPAVLHWVDDAPLVREGKTRYSLPFFQRPLPGARLTETQTVAQFLEGEVIETRHWHRGTRRESGPRSAQY